MRVKPPNPTEMRITASAAVLRRFGVVVEPEHLTRAIAWLLDGAPDEFFTIVHVLSSRPQYVKGSHVRHADELTADGWLYRAAAGYLLSTGGVAQGTGLTKDAPLVYHEEHWGAGRGAHNAVPKGR